MDVSVQTFAQMPQALSQKLYFCFAPDGIDSATRRTAMPFDSASVSTLPRGDGGSFFIYTIRLFFCTCMSAVKFHYDKIVFLFIYTLFKQITI
jgi:hypothetical protein